MTHNEQTRLTWIKSLSDGGPLFWIAFGGAVLYALSRRTPDPFWRNAIKVTSSALMGLGLHRDLAWIFHGNYTLTAVVLVSFGMLVLDGVTAALQRKDFVAELIKLVVAGRGK